MNIKNMNNYKDILIYIKENNIKNIEIRFLDKDFKICSFSINPSYLKEPIFNCNFFNFNNFSLLSLSFNRVFKDPFLVTPTLVFFTNLLEHKSNITDLINNYKSNSKINAYTINFYFTNKSSDYNEYTYSTPPFDNNRNIRDEIVTAASSIDVHIVVNFSDKKNGNTLIIKSTTPLDLLDNIEKIKYVILMVASVYNTPVNTSSGIFAETCLLNN